MVDVTPIPKLGPKKKPAKKRKPKSPMARADELWGAIIHLRFDRCCFCGKPAHAGKMDAHHVCVRSFKATRTDENNGLLLCWPKCHQDVAHGDPFAAVVHYTRIFGVDGYKALRDKAQAGVKANAAFWHSEVARLERVLAEEGLRQ